MKTFLTLFFSVCVLAASAQFQSEAFIKQQEKLHKRYTGQTTGAIVTGVASGLSFIGWGVTYAFKPVYTYTGTNPLIAQQQRDTYDADMKSWRTARLGLLIGGGATGITSVILGICA